MDSIEVFEDIVDYKGLYQVSNLGNVKSLNYNHTKKQELLKPSITPCGYFKVTLYKNQKQKTFRVHQLVAITFLNHKACGYTYVVNHINFKKLDNRVENLEIVTNRENSNRKHIKSSSQYVGVHWAKLHNKWRAMIKIDGKQMSLGSFENELEASQAYQSALKNIA
jgi:hypothetical protein